MCVGEKETWIITVNDVTGSRVFCKSLNRKLFLRVFLFLFTALLVLLSRGCGGSLPREPLLLVLLIALLPRHLHVVQLRGHLGELLPEAADLGDPQLLLLVEPLLALGHVELLGSLPRLARLPRRPRRRRLHLVSRRREPPAKHGTRRALALVLNPRAFLLRRLARLQRRLALLAGRRERGEGLELVPGVRVRTPREQLGADGFVVPRRRHVQRRVLEVPLRVDVGTRVHEERRHVPVAVVARPVQRRVTVRLLSVGVRTAVQQEGHRVGAGPLGGGGNQRRRARLGMG